MRSTPESLETLLRLRGPLDEIKIIATGGMAEIFKARQPSLGRHIVVKRLKNELRSSPEILERFRREAHSLATVLHQNVAHVYDFVEVNDDPLILMEFIDGIDVSTIIEKVGHLPADLAASILLGVAKGVSYIHAHNLIHRDIKPGNIRITTRGEVKLMDFGIVMVIENESLTRPGMMVGSPSYLSPEQILGDNISPRADIFLLGICLYEMLTGTRPFKNEDGETIFQRIRAAKYISPRKMQSTIPKALERIITKCLKLDPEARYRDVKALVGDLEEFLGTEKSSRAEDMILKFLDEEALIEPSVAYTDVNEETHQWRHYLKWPVMTAILVVGFIAFGGGYWMGKQGTKELLKKIPSMSTPFRF